MCCKLDNNIETKQVLLMNKSHDQTTKQKATIYYNGCFYDFQQFNPEKKGK